MTKEELAKKKGLKLPENNQTAAEALLTTKTEDAKKIEAKTNTGTKEQKPKTRKPSTKASAKKVQAKEPDTPKAGRPKGKPSTKISLNVPNELLELVSIAAGINFKGNTSSYIVSLIEKDIKANGKVYEQIKALQKA